MNPHFESIHKSFSEHNPDGGRFSFRRVSSRLLDCFSWTDFLKRPSFQFYPGDWLQDSSLRAVSLGAQGLWMNILCLMHQSPTYGYLLAGDKVNHKVISKVDLAKMIGSTLEEISSLLDELHQVGVFSKDERGCLFSRRMVRDESVRQSRACGGIKGGNPALLKDRNKVNLTDNHTLNLPPEDEDEDEEPILFLEGESEGKQSPELKIYDQYPKKVGKKTALKAIKIALMEHSFELLIERTKKFSQIRNGNMDYVQNPATWFNGGHFLDDEKTWHPRVNGRSTVPIDHSKGF